MFTQRILPVARALLVALFCGVASGAWAAAGSGDVVVTIKPLHSLVQGILGDTANARLLVKTGVSPHDFSLKPSHMQILHNARVVFYVSGDLESFLVKVIEVLPDHVQTCAVARNSGIALLEARYHVHAVEESAHTEGHTVAARAAHPGLQSAPDRCQPLKLLPAAALQTPAGVTGDMSSGETLVGGIMSGQTLANGRQPEAEQHKLYDMHVWLDPQNGIKILKLVYHVLSGLYPDNQAIFARNFDAMQRKITVTDTMLEQKFASLEEKPFVVYHDAYQYFEKRYGLQSIGAITNESGIPPSVKRISAIRQSVLENEVDCVFREPQYADKWVKTIVSNGKIKSRTADPMGNMIPAGRDLYIQLLNSMGADILTCLAQ